MYAIYYNILILKKCSTWSENVTSQEPKRDVRFKGPVNTGPYSAIAKVVQILCIEFIYETRCTIIVPKRYEIRRLTFKMTKMFLQAQFTPSLKPIAKLNNHFVFLSPFYRFLIGQRVEIKK